MKKTLPKFLVFLCVLLLMACAIEEDSVDVNQISDLKYGNLSLAEFKQIKPMLSAKLGSSVQGHDEYLKNARLSSEAMSTLDELKLEDRILMLQTGEYTSYTIPVVKSNNQTNTFQNVIIEESSVHDRIILVTYKPDQAYLKAIKLGLSVPFTGVSNRLLLYSYPKQMDRNGNPIVVSGECSSIDISTTTTSNCTGYFTHSFGEQCDCHYTNGCAPPTGSYTVSTTTYPCFKDCPISDPNCNGGGRGSTVPAGIDIESPTKVGGSAGINFNCIKNNTCNTTLTAAMQVKLDTLDNQTPCEMAEKINSLDSTSKVKIRIDTLFNKAKTDREYSSIFYEDGVVKNGVGEAGSGTTKAEMLENKIILFYIHNHPTLKGYVTSPIFGSGDLTDLQKYMNNSKYKFASNFAAIVVSKDYIFVLVIKEKSKFLKAIIESEKKHQERAVKFRKEGNTGLDIWTAAFIESFKDLGIGLVYKEKNEKDFKELDFSDGKTKTLKCE